MTILMLSGYLARKRNPGMVDELYSDLVHLPHLVSQLLEDESGFRKAISTAAKALAKSTGFFFIGRGYSFPIALEGALKLKEIAYVHAEGYAAGELKHGPIAMIDPSITVVVSGAEGPMARQDRVESRRSQSPRRQDSGNRYRRRSVASEAFATIGFPISQSTHESLMPFFLTPAVQLLSYDLAVIHGTDVDKPRNLAKSVTVE